jgi:hypothetical protein
MARLRYNQERAPVLGGVRQFKERFLHQFVRVLRLSSNVL